MTTEDAGYEMEQAAYLAKLARAKMPFEDQQALFREWDSAPENQSTLPTDAQLDAMDDPDEYAFWVQRRYEESEL